MTLQRSEDLNLVGLMEITFVAKTTISIFRFRAYNNWAWVPVIACPLGGVLGAIVYIITIEFHHSASADTEHPYEPICKAAARTEQNESLLS